MGQPCPNAFSMIRTSPSAFTSATSNRTSVRDPLGILPKYSFCTGIQTFHLARANARYCAVKITALLHFDKHQSIAIMCDQINLTAFCHANGAARLENHGVRNLLKCVLLPITPRDTTSHHDCDGFQRLCPSVIFSNVQRQLIYLSAWFAMRLGNGINSISHRHRLKRFSQHHV